MNLKSLYYKLTEGIWTIGFLENSLDSVIKGEPISVKWLQSDYKDGWFADPFILDVSDDELVVLVEEFYYPIRRGRISKLTIDRKTMTLKALDVVLQLDTHLSFPAIIRKGERIYIYPENSDSKKLTLYEYDRYTNMCRPVDTWINEPLTDAVYTSLFGKDLIFSTKLPIQNGNRLDVYEKENTKTSYTKVDTIHFSDNIARNGGDFFTNSGDVFRPAQDCNGGYGTAIILQKVKRSRSEHYCFENVRRIESMHPHYNRGLHTFNSYKGMIVVDVRGYRYGIGKWIHSWIKRLRK